MSLSAISNTSGLSIAQLFGLPSSTTSSSATDATTTTTAAASGGPGRFASAIQDAFASLGISLDGTGTSTTTAAASATSADGNGTSTDAASDAVSAFLQSLFAALHGQTGGGTPPPPTDASTDPASATAATSGTTATTTAAATDDAAPASGAPRAHHGHAGHHGKLEGDLQSLISELQASSSTDAGSTSAASTTTGTTNPTLSALEKNYDAVLAQSGATTTGSDSLTAFLQALASKLQGAPATGNVVTAQA